MKRSTGGVVLVLCFLLLVDSAKAASVRLGCLFDRQNLTGVDLDSGQQFGMNPPVMDASAIYAPNKSRFVYEALNPNGADNTSALTIPVWVTSLSSSTPLTNHLVRNITVQAMHSPLLQKNWSRDSQWLVYLWFDADSHWHLGLADQRGQEQRAIQLDATADDTLTLLPTR